MTRDRGSRGVRHEKLKRDFGAAAAEKRLNSNSNNFFRPHSRMGRTPVSVFRKCHTQRECVCDGKEGGGGVKVER